MAKMSNDSLNILLSGKQEVIDLEPIVQRKHLKLAIPSLQDNRADVDRIQDYLCKQYGKVNIPFNLMGEIPEVCRRYNWDFSVLLSRANTGWELTGSFQPGDSEGQHDHYGIAVDIGTTTVVASLINMKTGVCVETVATYNKQIQYGDDILTRIHFASSNTGLLMMQNAITETLNGLIGQLCSRNKLRKTDTLAIVVGANTVMMHFLLGFDSSRICKEPYIPTVNNVGFLRACDTGIKIHPQGILYCLPSVGSYIGGDILAGVLVSNMFKRKDISLLVDIGTNGEIILGNSDWLVACAGAAGPALEGAVVASGMRAEEGAIESVSIESNGTVAYRVIGDSKPGGICGSGLVDCLSEMLLHGVIDRSGRFVGGKDYFTVVPKEYTADNESIIVTQVDVKNILRTKGAVNAAIEVLLEGVGCDMSDIDYFFSAGAFGRYLDVESAITIGLYPDLPRNKMTQLGNSSLEGARQVLLSTRKLDELEKIADRITYFELNASQDFMNKFVGSKFFPHTNLDFYPTVRDKLYPKIKKTSDKDNSNGHS